MFPSEDQPIMVGRRPCPPQEKQTTTCALVASNYGWVKFNDCGAKLLASFLDRGIPTVRHCNGAPILLLGERRRKLLERTNRSSLDLYRDYHGKQEPTLQIDNFCESATVAYTPLSTPRAVGPTSVTRL